MESADGLDVYTYQELESITSGFSAENFIGNTQCGKLFWGEIQRGFETQEVTVKTWDDEEYPKLPKSQQSRLSDEIELLENSGLKWHPNLVKLIGYCRENGRLGVVYGLRSLDTVQNLLLQDNFKWIDRIKVGLGFACLLEALHGQELLVRNIDAAHVMVDKAFNPRLLDFSMLVGGVFGGIPPYEYIWGPYGYMDPYICNTGTWSDKTDVYAYGFLLLELISKRAYDRQNQLSLWARGERRSIQSCKRPKFKSLFCTGCDWTKGEHKGGKCKSLVHKSFEIESSFDACDGVAITKLAMRCIEYYPSDRPTMRDVVHCLRELNVVQCCGHILGIP